MFDKLRKDWRTLRPDLGLSRTSCPVTYDNMYYGGGSESHHNYRKVPKFSDVRKLCCNLPKFQIKRPNLRVFRQKDANEIANSEDPDQTAPLGAV